MVSVNSKIPSWMDKVAGERALAGKSHFDSFLEHAATVHIDAGSFSDDDDDNNDSYDENEGEKRATVSENYYKIVVEELSKLKKCAYCDKMYVPMENFGRLECSYHPMQRSFGHQRNYSCCNKSKDMPGCTRCDHKGSATVTEITDGVRFRWDMKSYIIKIPLMLLNHVNPNPEQIISQHNGSNEYASYACIRRVF